MHINTYASTHTHTHTYIWTDVILSVMLPCCTHSHTCDHVSPDACHMYLHACSDAASEAHAPLNKFRVLSRTLTMQLWSQL